MRIGIASCIIGVLTLVARAWGSWAAYTLETRLFEADLVVVGTMGAVREGPKENNRDYSLGALQIQEVLKGDDTLKTVDVTFPTKDLVATDQVYSPGVSGIFILRQDPDRDFYWGNLPTDRQAITQKDKIVKLLKFQSERTWGQAQNGLAMYLYPQFGPDIDRGKFPSPIELQKPGIPLLAFFVKNTGDKPLWIADWAGDAPVEVHVSRDREAQPNLDPYAVAWRAPFSRTVNWFKLRPGQVHPVGGAGGEMRMIPFQQAGTYALTATFTSKRTGELEKLPDVWIGTVTSNTVSSTMRQVQK